MIQENKATQTQISLDAFFPGVYEGSTGEVERLRKCHELHVKYAPLWNFYLAAYEGGADFANSDNIFKHIRENDDDFNDRTERLHNINYCECLVDFFTNFIFSEVIDRSGGSNQPFYQQFIQNVDRKNSTIDRFMRTVGDDMQIFGMAYGLVDAPLITQSTVVTKYDEQVLGIRPYWVLVKPDEITDWVTDELGNYIYAKRRQMTSEIEGRNLIKVEKFTEFTPSFIRISKVKVNASGRTELLDQAEVPNTLGKIPLRVCRFKESKRDPVMGLSFLRDFAFNNREILNLTSLLQEFLYRQAFNILAKEVDSTVTLRDQEEGVIGTANMMEVPKGAKLPEYISPPVDPAKFIMEERGRIKAEMFSRAAQDAMQELFNGEGSSGFSQAQSFSKTAPHIACRADALEEFEVEMMRLTMERIGKEWDGKVQYKDRYEMTNLTDGLAQLKLLVRDFQIPSETFVKSELKRLVRAYDGKLPADVVAKVENEIEDMDWNEWMDTQQVALVGRQSSPAASSSGVETNGQQTTPTISEVSQESRTTASIKKPRDKKK